MSFYYSTNKVRKRCVKCETWKTTKDHFKKTHPVQDGFNSYCTLCESKEQKKECGHCKEKLIVSRFTKLAKSKDGYKKSCKKCVKDMAEQLKRDRIAGKKP